MLFGVALARGFRQWVFTFPPVVIAPISGVVHVGWAANFLNRPGEHSVIESKVPECPHQGRSERQHEGRWQERQKTELPNG
jgi:hypothetical protein